MLFISFILSSLSLAALFDWTNAGAVVVKNVTRPTRTSLAARQDTTTLPYVWTDDVPNYSISVTFDEITCDAGGTIGDTSSTGCTGNVEQALESAVTFLANELGPILVNQTYASGGSVIVDYIGAVTGHDAYYGVYVYIYFQIYNANDFVTFINHLTYQELIIGSLAQYIANGFQDNNEIIQCVFFQDWPANPWGSAVATIGWNGDVFALSSSDQQSIISNCWDNANHDEY